MRREEGIRMEWLLLTGVEVSRGDVPLHRKIFKNEI